MTLSTKSVLLDQGRTNNTLAIKRLNGNSMELAEAVIAGKKPLETELPIDPEDGRSIIHMGVPIYSKDGKWYYYSNNVEVGASATRWAPMFDGVSTYMTLNTISLQAGDVVTFKMIAPLASVGGADDYLLAGTNFGIYHRAGNDQLRWTTNVSALHLNGELFTLYDPIPLDGETYEVALTIASSATIELVGISTSLEEGSIFTGGIYDLAVNDTIVAPLDEPFADYPNLVGATAVGFTSEDVISTAYTPT